MQKIVPWKEVTVGEAGLRARVRKEGADPEEADSGEAIYLWVVYVCRSRDQRDGPGRQSRLQGP